MRIRDKFRILLSAKSGQDQLTFLCSDKRKIIGYFIDCREGSDSYGTRLIINFSASAKRRLIIPRGIAHSFDNLARVVTRDEPIWYSDFYNPDWDINNDLISIPRTIRDEDLPKVRVNAFRLPEQAHTLFSRLQQDLLVDARRYGKREKLESTYQVSENSTWNDDKDEYQKWLKLDHNIPGLKFVKNNFALTGSKSYTLVPSTESCISDILELTFAEENNFFWVHHRQKVAITILSNEGHNISLEFCDLRSSIQERKIHTINFQCEPRLRIIIPHGVAYRIRGNNTQYFRYETELFVDINEPRVDIPAIGSDTLKLLDAEVLLYPQKDMPSIKCPSSVLSLLARQEIDTYNNKTSF